MTVKELRDALDGLADSHLVILSKDEEGNGYKQLADVADMWVDLDDPYWPDILDEGDIPESESERQPDRYRRCVVLWP